MDTVVETRDFSAAAINQSLTPEDKIRFLKQMLQIRRFEQAATQAYQSNKIGGFLHLYIGQESVAVGTCSLLGTNDHVITAYRDHGHALSMGMNMNECMAELYGKATGCSKGKGGSMHFFAPDKNFWGGHGIVAGQTPLGLGLAYALKYKGVPGAALCFLGDGAVNQGCYYECLNLASLFDLPIIYIIENNGYSMGTSQERSSAFRTCLAERAAGFAVDWDTCNGEDLYEVRAKTQVALDRAQKQSRPTVLEIDTYRYYGHSIADAKHKGGYRSEEEIERYKNEHDPIGQWRTQLLKEGVITEDAYNTLDQATTEEADDAMKFAEESPWPTEASITEDVYFEVDRQTQAGRTGRHFFNS